LEDPCELSELPTVYCMDIISCRKAFSLFIIMDHIRSISKSDYFCSYMKQDNDLVLVPKETVLLLHRTWVI